MSTSEAIFPLKVTLESGYEHFENPCPMLADVSSVNIQFTKYPILQKQQKMNLSIFGIFSFNFSSNCSLIILLFWRRSPSKRSLNVFLLSLPVSLQLFFHPFFIGIPF